ncbi:AAA family ATPase [Streptomyces sp. 6N223]|uniref:AAA family ATPase n=1 Tax=Streptomyces sp. 6N223 TaxID=3457412 RepID=UPI003FD50E7E
MTQMTSDAGDAPPLKVIAFTGLPGTGKSTLAERVATTIRAPAFAGDWLMGALKPHGVLAALDRPAYLAMYYGLLETLITRQLMLRQSAVTDCLLNDAVITTWREVTDAYGATLHVVECVCTDQSLHRSRVEGRARNIPGWHEVGWDHVERMRTEYPPLTVERLVVDAVNPVEDGVRTVLSHLASGPLTS